MQIEVVLGQPVGRHRRKHLVDRGENRHQGEANQVNMGVHRPERAVVAGAHVMAKAHVGQQVDYRDQQKIS